MELIGWSVQHNFDEAMKYCPDQPLPVTHESEGEKAMTGTAGIIGEVGDDRMSNRDRTSENLVCTSNVREEASGGPSQNKIASDNEQISVHLT